MKKLTLVDLFHGVLNSKNWEPEERWCAGVFGMVRHRFHIKGGITYSKVLSLSMQKNNKIYQLLGRGEK